MIVIAVELDCKAHMLDVQTEFFNADVDEDVDDSRLRDQRQSKSFSRPGAQEWLVWSPAEPEELVRQYGRGARPARSSRIRTFTPTRMRLASSC